MCMPELMPVEPFFQAGQLDVFFKQVCEVALLYPPALALEHILRR